MLHKGIRTSFNDLLQGFAFDEESRSHAPLPASVAFSRNREFEELAEIADLFSKAAFRLGDSEAALELKEAQGFILRDGHLPSPLPVLENESL